MYGKSGIVRSRKEKGVMKIYGWWLNEWGVFLLAINKPEEKGFKGYCRMKRVV